MEVRLGLGEEPVPLCSEGIQRGFLISPAHTVQPQTTLFSEFPQCFLPGILVTSLLFDKST